MSKQAPAESPKCPHCGNDAYDDSHMSGQRVCTHPWHERKTEKAESPKPEPPPELRYRYNEFWNSLTRQGDPERIHNKIWVGYRAGWEAKGEPPRWMSEHSEALLALNDYVNIRDKVGEMEPVVEECCSCDANNFHRCEACEEIAQWETELRRLLDLWGDRWALMLNKTIALPDPPKEKP